MSLVKRQHYVPQSYLQRFARSERLYAFDKPQARSYATNIRDVAADRFFYDLPELDALASERQALEKFFHGFEQAGAAAIERIVRAAHTDDAIAEVRAAQIDLSIFLAVQFLRTKETRTAIVQGSELLYKELFVRHLEREHPSLAKFKNHIKLESVPERQVALHAGLLLDDSVRERIAEGLFRRVWLLMWGSRFTPFYTSDHPVVSHIPESWGAYGSGGILSRAGQLIFPLSSRLLLMLVDPVIYPQAILQAERVQFARPEHIEYFNHLQVRHSYRQVYCEQRTFALAHEMVTETPELRDVLLPRIVAH